MSPRGSERGDGADRGVRLVVDGGATTLRMAVVAGSEPARRVEVPGFQWTAGQEPVAQQCERVAAAWEALGRPAPVEVVALGLAGGASDLQSRRRLAPMVAERLGARRVLLTGDDITTHLGVLGGGAGVVVAAGTGVACLAVTPEGRLINVDGLGYLFGDAGSGFSLGLAGIRAGLAGLDGRGPATALTRHAEERVGTPLLEAVRLWYRSPTLIADIAGFAPVVSAAAEADEPDGTARRLCEAAGHDLAVSVAAAVRQGFPAATGGSVPVSWAGQVLRSPVVFEAFSVALDELCPAASPRSPVGDSIAGAVRLARGDDVPHLANVVLHDVDAVERPDLEETSR